MKFFFAIGVLRKKKDKLKSLETSGIKFLISRNNLKIDLELFKIMLHAKSTVIVFFADYRVFTCSVCDTKSRQTALLIPQNSIISEFSVFFFWNVIYFPAQFNQLFLNFSNETLDNNLF